MNIFRLKKFIWVGFAFIIIDSSLYAGGAAATYMSKNTVISSVEPYGLRTDLANINATITSSGNITSTVSGIAFESGLSSDYTILNEGNVTALDASFYGIKIDGVNDGTITNKGTITTNSWVVNTSGGTGTLTNDTTGILHGNLNIGSSGIVTNRGMINLLGASTSTIAGNFSQTSSGTLSIDANITGANSATHSKLTVAGTATLNDGTNIRVDVSGTDANQTAFLTAGSTLDDVISAGTLDVNVSNLNITDNSALLSFTAIKDGNTLDLTTEQALSISEAVSKAGMTSQSGQAAKVLDDLGAGASGEVGTFITYLNTLPTNATVAQTVTQITPKATVSIPTIGTQIVNTMSNVVQARQTSVRGFSSGDIAFSDKNVWIKPFGGYTKQDDVNGINGFVANTFGLGFGVDGEYRAGNRVGLSFFYTKADINTNGLTQTSDLDVFNLISYGSTPVVDDKTNFFYQIGLGLQKTNTSRTITAVSKTATANFNAKSIHLQLKATRDIQITESFTVKPGITTLYTYYKNPSYTESGAGGLNLQVEEFTSETFVLGIESDFNYDINKDTKLLSTIALRYDFNNKAQSVNSSLQDGGAMFSTKGIENDALIYAVGFGLEKKVNKDIYLDIKYDLDGRGSDFLNHVFSANFNYQF